MSCNRTKLIMYPVFCSKMVLQDPLEYQKDQAQGLLYDYNWAQMLFKAHKCFESRNFANALCLSRNNTFSYTVSDKVDPLAITIEIVKPFRIVGCISLYWIGFVPARLQCTQRQTSNLILQRNTVFSTCVKKEVCSAIGIRVHHLDEFLTSGLPKRAERFLTSLP